MNCGPRAKHAALGSVSLVGEVGRTRSSCGAQATPRRCRFMASALSTARCKCEGHRIR